MGFIKNKKAKGVVASALTFSAVAPHVVGAQGDFVNKVG